MKLWADRACWTFAWISACMAIAPCAETRDLLRRKTPDAQCGFASSFLERFDRWSIRRQGYTRILVGTVREAEDISDTNKRVDLIPEEAFVGDESELTATVRDVCLPDNLPEIKAGDRWLFFVRPKLVENKITRHIATEGYEISWDSPSKPVDQAADDIATLRRLRELTDESILTGHVVRIGPTFDNLNPTPIPNHKVIARNLHTGIEYTAFTTPSGRFEFELPHGHYEVTASTTQGLRDVHPFTENPFLLEYGLGGNATVGPHDWTELKDFRLVVDGKLAGQVTTADGRPASLAKVAIIPISPVRPQFIVTADENGHFEVDGRQPGKYLVGVGLLAPFDSEEWKSRVYYPGVTSRNRAKAIQLGVGEWRTDINFKLMSAR